MTGHESFDWRTLFAPGESPYFAMFRCGCMGIPIEDCLELCTRMNVPLRQKDIRAWKDGDWNAQLKKSRDSVLNPIIRPGYANIVPVLDSKLSDFDSWPSGWTGSTRRWFPCNEDNCPMQKWGYSAEYTPTLYEREAAQALSPRGWVGQNLYAQPFIVIDIDGVGHGERDDEVIAFGNRYRNFTETWENPAKPGSFHLYFSTDRQIPISHFPYAKLDLMGNQKNAAVYTKDKVPNGVQRALLNDAFWKDLQSYLRGRKERRDKRELYPPEYDDGKESS
jgi:hypothetical protein